MVLPDFFSPLNMIKTYIFKYGNRNIMSEPYLLAINLSIKVNNKTVCGAENGFIWFIITSKSCVP